MVDGFNDVVGDQGEYELLAQTVSAVEEQLVQEKLKVRSLEGILRGFYII